MKKIMNKRGLLTVITGALCAVTIGCTANMLVSIEAKAMTTADVANSSKTNYIGSITKSSYDSSVANADVFDGQVMSKLYDALTGTTDGSATYNKVAASVLGTTTAPAGKSYGHKVNTTIPYYLNASDLYSLNGNKNIVLGFGGQEWQVTFLTRDQNNNVIVTLWMTQPLQDNGAGGAAYTTIDSIYVGAKFGWATASYNINYNSTSLSTPISNAYSTSAVRVAALNGGSSTSSGAISYYTSASATASVTLSQRQSHPLANFTLDNSVLGNNMSLTRYIVQPFDVDYTYCLDWPYAGGSGNGSSYILNEALTRDASGNLVTGNLSGTVGNNDCNFYTANKGAHVGAWWNKGVYNYAYSTANHYNDWGSDYVWAPSLSETGRVNGTTVTKGLWGTGDNINKGTQFKNASTNPPSQALSGSTVSSEYVWLRSGGGNNPDNARYLTSSGSDYNAFPAAGLAVRPALHLNLTSAASAAGAETIEVPVPKDVTEEYNGTAQYLNEWKTLTAAGSSALKYPWIDDYHQQTTAVTVSKIEYTSINSAGTYATTATDVTTAGTAGIIHAGKYEITLKIDTTNTKYRWRDENASVTEKKFTVKITQPELKYDLKFYDSANNYQSSKKAEYTGSAVSVKLETSGTTKPGSNLHNVTVYYLGSGSGNTYGTAANTDGNVDDSGKGLGCSTGPKNGGTYAAAFLDSATKTDYKLVPNTSGGQTLTFQITPVQVTLPTIGGSAQTYNAGTLSYNISNYNKNIVEVTGVSVSAKEGGQTKNYTLSYDTTSGTFYYEPTPGVKNYEVKIDDSGSIVKAEVTDAGEYTLEFGLKDTTNSEWASGVPTNKTASLTVNRAAVTVAFSAPGTTGFSWNVGDTGNIAVSTIGNTQGSDAVTVTLSWYKSDNQTPAALYSTGVPDTTQFDITTLSTAGTYYLRAQLEDDTGGANINRNYTIDSTDTNLSEAETYVQQLSVNAGSASLDNVIWQYQAGAAGIPANINGATLTYNKVSGAAVAYTVTAINFPTFCQVAGYSNATKTEAGTYTATVTLEILSSDRTDQKMPNPASDGYVYAGEGTNYQYVNDYTCTIDLSWTIEKMAIDLSNVPFEYSNDGGITYSKYDSTNPPESNGLNYKAQVNSNDYPDGVTGVTFTAGTDMKGPGTIYFDFEFTLDDNHKSDSGSNTVNYSMRLTGKQIKVEYTYEKLIKNDGSGNEWKSNTGVTFMVYKLKLDATTAAQIAPYLEYEYYTVDTSVTPNVPLALIGKDYAALNQIIDSVATGGMGACDNPVKVFVRPVLSNMTQIGGEDPYVLKFTSAHPEYKSLTVGDNKDPVDLTAGTLTSMTYGETVNITDAYVLTIRPTSGPLPVAGFKVSLHDSNGEIAADATSYDFSTLKVGSYDLVFDLVAPYDDSYVLTDSSLTFTVNPIKLVAPTLKDGANLVFNGGFQSVEQYLENFNPTYMEFASNSMHEMYHAGGYKAIIKIKDGYKDNYVFTLPEAVASTTKKPVKALVDGETGSVPVLSDGNTVAAVNWSISKFVYDTTQKSAWNFAKDGASLSYNGVPASIKALTIGSEPTLIFNIVYFDAQGNYLDNVEFKGGTNFLVAAYIDPACADANDIEFKNQEYNPMISTTTSPQMTYTVPKSGFSAALSTVKDFMMKQFFGLPFWCWLLIALAVLILLIIIIVVAKKRAKTKEEREAKKAAKEEEKQRREEERRMQQEKLEAERELARAKQEAEIEKIKAQAQAGMAGAGVAGMASMAMAQPAQQQMAVADANAELMREMREQMAEMRAENRAAQAQLQAMQYQPPVYQPQYQQPAPVQAAPAASSDIMTLMDLKLQISELKTAQAQAEKNNQQQQPNFGYMGMGMGYGMPVMTPYGMQAIPAQPQVMTPYGMLPAYGYAPMTMLPQTSQPVQTVKKEEEEQPAPVQQTAPSMTMSQPPYCPPGAVMTTTTTIDTSKTMDSKSKSTETESNSTRSSDVRRRSEDTVDDLTFDVDGFYDPLD